MTSEDRMYMFDMVNSMYKLELLCLLDVRKFMVSFI
jgi:hypothetical protein